MKDFVHNPKYFEQTENSFALGFWNEDLNIAPLRSCLVDVSFDDFNKETG